MDKTQYAYGIIERKWIRVIGLIIQCVGEHICSKTLLGWILHYFLLFYVLQDPDPINVKIVRRPRNAVPDLQHRLWLQFYMAVYLVFRGNLPGFQCFGPVQLGRIVCQGLQLLLRAVRILKLISILRLFI